MIKNATANITPLKLLLFISFLTLFVLFNEIDKKTTAPNTIQTKVNTEAHLPNILSDLLKGVVSMQSLTITFSSISLTLFFTFIIDFAILITGAAIKDAYNKCKSSTSLIAIQPSNIKIDPQELKNIEKDLNRASFFAGFILFFVVSPHFYTNLMERISIHPLAVTLISTAIIIITIYYIIKIYISDYIPLAAISDILTNTYQDPAEKLKAIIT